MSTPNGADRAALRRHHRRRHGAGVVHAAGAARQAGRGRGAAAGREDGHGPGDAGARQGDGSRLHLLRRLRRGEPPGRPVQGPGGRARVPAADGQGGQQRDQEDAAPQAGGHRRVHRHRRAHRRHRRDPQHQGVRRREGAGVLPGGQGREPRRPGAGARAGGPGARGEGRRRAGLPGRHPARRPPDQHPRDVGGVPRVLPRRPDPAAGGRRPALRRARHRRARRRPDLRARHHARRGRELPGARHWKDDA